jgi:alpha-ketoglutaric semialdehyde dehydrogenase
MVKKISNWINGEQIQAVDKKTFNKLNPANGKLLYRVARSNSNDVIKAINTAKKSQLKWGAIPAVQRGLILHEIVLGLIKRKNEIAKFVHIETGKSMKDALGETNGAIQCGLFFASEGQRLYGKTLQSGSENKFVSSIREPIGIAGLIIAANTPIANVAWKVFPALVCGNSVVLKAAEDAPATAWIFGEIAHQAGIPKGVLNIVQGYGPEAGEPIIENKDIGVISFTGSTKVGRLIQEKTSNRFVKLSLELGGKNPLIVCDDADLDCAVKWVLLSAFSNAGQRCAAASRIIIFDSIYDDFKNLLIEKTKQLSVGTSDNDDLGPVINQRQLDNMLNAVERSKEMGAEILIGGQQLKGKKYEAGYFIAPTILENISPEDSISNSELFGPITCLYRVENFDDAIKSANNSDYGLTACIHTNNHNRANTFVEKIKSGTAVINAGTYGSEPHMPFGGLKNSGNGTREPGSESLEIYSNLKLVHYNYLTF